MSEAFTGQRRRIVRVASRALALTAFPVPPVEPEFSYHNVYPRDANPQFNIDLPNPYSQALPGYLQLSGDLGVDRAEILEIRLHIETHGNQYSRDYQQVKLVLDGNTYLDWTDLVGLGDLTLRPPWPTGFFPTGVLDVYIRGAYSREGHPTPTHGLIVSYYYLELVSPP